MNPVDTLVVEAAECERLRSNLPIDTLAKRLAEEVVALHKEVAALRAHLYLAP